MIEIPAVVREIVSYFPRYMDEFGSTFVGPKRFFSRLKVESQAAFSDSLSFLGLSLVLMVLAQSPLMVPGIPFWRHLTGNAVVTLVTVSLYAVALHVAWRLVGGKATVREFFVVYARVSGVAGIFYTVFLLLGEGIFKVFDPLLYEEVIRWVRAGRMGDAPDVLNSWVWWAAFGVQIVGFLFIAVWVLFTWGAYRVLSGLSVGRSVLAYFLFGILAAPAFLIVVLLVRAVS